MTTLQRIQALFPIGTNVVANTDGPFSATVVGHRIESDGTPLFTVRDQEDQCFDCEAHELTLEDAS